VSDEDYVLLVSERVDKVPEGHQWPGSVVRWCHLCSDAIWLSREAVQKCDADPKVRPTCAACATPMMEETARSRDGKLVVHKVDPEGAPIRPVLDYLKREYGSG
jgi:hypothetical protein